MNKPIISVIMLTYNRENLVGRAIKSILGQTFENFEFIIVDNGSSDGSGRIADEYAQRDCRIRVLHQPRGNIGSGRNAGLDIAKGEYVGFIDDDDWVEQDFLEFLYTLATENHADISICGATDKAFDEKRIMAPEEAVIELLLRKRYNVQFPTKLLRRKLFEENRFSDSAKYDDIELMPQILASANCIAYHGLPKYTFYRHEGNNSAWTTNHNLLNGETLDEYLSVYRLRTDRLCGLFPGSTENWKYFEWSFMISMVEKINRLGLADCSRQLGVMCEELNKNRETFLENGLICDFEKAWMNQYISV